MNKPVYFGRYLIMGRLAYRKLYLKSQNAVEVIDESFWGCFGNVCRQGGEPI